MIDQSVYPDGAHAETFVDDLDRADYVHRICAAFDFGIAPEPDTVALFRSWRDVFERFPLLDSPGYHALRAHFRWSRMPVAMHPLAAPWEVLDAREERDDPCRDLV